MQILIPELEHLIRNIIKEEILNSGLMSPVESVEIINRKTLCERLGITEPTAIQMEKRGRINSLRVGASVRYNWQEVVKALGKKAKY